MDWYCRPFENLSPATLLHMTYTCRDKTFNVLFMEELKRTEKLGKKSRIMSSTDRFLMFKWNKLQNHEFQLRKRSKRTRDPQSCKNLQLSPRGISSSIKWEEKWGLADCRLHWNSLVSWLRCTISDEKPPNLRVRTRACHSTAVSGYTGFNYTKVWGNYHPVPCFWKPSTKKYFGA